MKKKISLIVCMLVACTMALPAVPELGNELTAMTKILLSQNCNRVSDQLLPECGSIASDSAVGQICDDLNLEYQLMQSGLPVYSRRHLPAALESWQAPGIKECGAYVSHGDYSNMRTSKDELKVTTAATFKDRDAHIGHLYMTRN